MEYVDEIGIEREFFLIASGDKIVEPWKYGFPYDEFGFLVEIRTRPHKSPSKLLEELEMLTRAHEAQAKVLGLRLVPIHRHLLSKDFVNYLAKKYHYSALLDITANIYAGIMWSHATGLEDAGQSYIGTAGIHVHFSRRTKDGLRVQLPIHKIVGTMDDFFSRIIERSRRNKGEYEIKAHGFEYRALPANISVKLVVKKAFEILHAI